jgi:hypothetical protein
MTPAQGGGMTPAKFRQLSAVHIPKPCRDCGTAIRAPGVWRCSACVSRRIERKGRRR